MTRTNIIEVHKIFYNKIDYDLNNRKLKKKLLNASATYGLLSD